MPLAICKEDILSSILYKSNLPKKFTTSMLYAHREAVNSAFPPWPLRYREWKSLDWNAFLLKAMDYGVKNVHQRLDANSEQNSILRN